ncbi:hypothetical protein L208DRAFT_1397238 [Tricholoma matsutake]|nr:hypothetical protein L208DRAFT_1397238 [Tricholoma matsutake 945]
MYANINLDVFECIIIDHFCMANNFQVVGCVMLPVHEAVKTKAEVVAMEMVQCKHPFYQQPEWILMEYLWGKLLGDCFRRLTNQQKLHTSVDLAMVMSLLFIITVSYIGSLLPELRKDDSNAGHYALQYPLDSHPLCEATTFTQDVQFHIRPMNDITLLDYPNQVLASLCGHFNSEFDFLEVFAFCSRLPTRLNNKLDCWAFNKVFKVYCTIQPLYRGFIGSSSDLPDETYNSSYLGLVTFHFSHGDFSSWNILVDPQSGTITSVIDWEMASFCSTWLADQFLMTDDQSRHLKYGDDNLGDAEVCSHFHLQFMGQNMELAAIFYACCHTYPGNAEIWLEKYEKHE